jgi:hypothetical protein
MCVITCGIGSGSKHIRRRGLESVECMATGLSAQFSGPYTKEGYLC